MSFVIGPGGSYVLFFNFFGLLKNAFVIVSFFFFLFIIIITLHKCFIHFYYVNLHIFIGLPCISGYLRNTEQISIIGLFLRKFVDIDIFFFILFV